MCELLMFAWINRGTPVIASYRLQFEVAYQFATKMQPLVQHFAQLHHVLHVWPKHQLGAGWLLNLSQWTMLSPLGHQGSHK